MGDYDIRFSIGSMSDQEAANVFLELMKKFGIKVHPSVASCHWSAGHDFTEFIGNIEEDLIVMMGGMSFAAAGITAGTLRNLECIEKIVFAIPLDEAALSAIQDLPPGTPVITCGFNKKDVGASITNAAIAVAMMIAQIDQDVRENILEYYKKKRAVKGIVEKLELDQDGLIPKPSKKS